MKDLLTKNLDDRIENYLARMDGMTVDEIVNGAALPNTPPRRARHEFSLPSKQQKIID
mgnify:CR=1 FL=1